MRFKTGFALVVIGAHTLALLGCQSAALRAAKLYKQQGNWERALEQLEVAVAENPQDDEGHFLLGEAYARTGEYGRMNEAFHRALELSSRWQEKVKYERRRVWVEHYNRGITALQEEDFEAAAIEYEKATFIDPEESDAFNNLAFAYYKLNRLDDCIAAYLKALELTPENAELLTNIGIFYSNKGEYGDAVHFLERGLNLGAENANLLTTLGDAYASMGENDAALGVYTRAIEQNPDDPELLARMGRAHWLANDYDQAEEYYKLVLNLDPDDPETRYELAATYIKMERMKDALPVLEKLVEMDPENKDGWYWLGYVYAHLDMAEESKQAFAQVEALKAR